MDDWTEEKVLYKNFLLQIHETEVDVESVFANNSCLKNSCFSQSITAVFKWLI